MTYQERFAEGPEDQPSPEFRPDCPTCDTNAETWFVGVYRGREMFQCLRCGKYYERPGLAPVTPRVVCTGWEDVHTETRVLSEGSEPVSHGMCADCGRAFTTVGQ